MLANQNMLIETMQATHKQNESVLSLLQKVCGMIAYGDGERECESLRGVIKDTDSMFLTLRDASTGDLKEALADVKKYASDVVANESRELQATLKKRFEAVEAESNDKFKKLESRVLSELAGGGGDLGDSGGRTAAASRAGDSQLLKKVTNRLGDFEAQVTSQLQAMSADLEKKVAYMGSQRGGGGLDGGSGPGMESYAHDLDSIKYDIGELKDMVNGSKSETAHVKRVVLACERDMEDFTAAMDAVNVDLDEMRARVDSTHSIITSRQRVEATVTAEISTMRLDMGDMQEALKAHDAWMEDVSQSLQEAHERCHQLSEDIAELRDQTQAKLDAKTDILQWNDMNDDIDASIKTVRDMASALRIEVDSRRRTVDETIKQVFSEIKQLDSKVDMATGAIRDDLEQNANKRDQGFKDSADQRHQMEENMLRHAETQREMATTMEETKLSFEKQLAKVRDELVKQDEEMHKEINERVDGVERHHGSTQKNNDKKLNALDLRISALQGSAGDAKREIGKLRDEANSLTVKSAAHDVDIGKCSDDIRKLERNRLDDSQRHKQDMDAIYEELDQKVYEKNFQGLEDNVTKLTRGAVKLCQVVGVFPGARMSDGTEEELDVDVELLNWEDCAQNLAARVEKAWRQASSQKFRSVLDLVGKKADHSVLRLLQISQQHIESQLDRVRHERELWKEVVDKRAQQPLQLALTLKDPHTGQPVAGPGGPGFGIQPALQNAYMAGPRNSDGMPGGPAGMMPPGVPGMPGAGGGVPAGDQPRGGMKESPLAKRIHPAAGGGRGAAQAPKA
jgi:hypothetical protein